MSDLWIRLSTATYANRGKWDIELEWILATKLFTGVRVNIGLGGADATNDIAAGSAPDTSPNLANLEYVVRRCAAAGLKCLIGLGGDGPPNTSFWRGKNTTAVYWLDAKRPALGASGTDVVNATRAVKQKVIDKVDEIYRSYGLSPYEYVYWELFNEPAIGGAGAPPSGSAFYSGTGFSFSGNQGRWDKAADVAFPTVSDGATFIEYFTRELEGLNFRGIRCVSPTFTAAFLDTEISTFDQAATNGKKWIDVCRANEGFVELIFGINCYYAAFDLEPSGLHPELYAGPCMGPVEYAELAVFGDDYRGSSSGDNQCIAKKLKKLRDNARIGRSQIAICEAGVMPTYMGMSGDAGSPSVGYSDFSYYVNFQKLGEAQLMYLDQLRSLDVHFVAHFTATNVSASWTQLYGVFRHDLSVLGLPALQDKRTVSSAIAWVRRAGLPKTVLIDGDYGAFWGANLFKGDYEFLP